MTDAQLLAYAGQQGVACTGQVTRHLETVAEFNQANSFRLLQMEKGGTYRASQPAGVLEDDGTMTGWLVFERLNFNAGLPQPPLMRTVFVRWNAHKSGVYLTETCVQPL